MACATEASAASRGLNAYGIFGYAASLLITVLVLFLGVVLFSRVEKSFMATV